MGMFDYFEPDPEISCPRCGRVLSGWQGKDADNALFVWQLGVRHPTSQCVDEDIRLTAEDLTKFTLPEEFTIYTHCTCSTEFFFVATGTSVDGVWLQTRLMQPEDIEKCFAHLPRTRRKAMRKWLQERVK